jgi:hypothetical protein
VADALQEPVLVLVGDLEPVARRRGLDKAVGHRRKKTGFFNQLLQLLTSSNRTLRKSYNFVPPLGPQGFVGLAQLPTSPQGVTEQ